MLLIVLFKYFWSPSKGNLSWSAEGAESRGTENVEGRDAEGAEPRSRRRRGGMEIGKSTAD